MLSRHFISSRISGFFCGVLLTFAISTARAQDLHLVFKDKVTDQPVEFAHIIAKSLSGKAEECCISDMKGKAIFSINFPVVIAVSSLGFKTYVDTFNTGGEHIIMLSPEYYQLDRLVVTGQYRPQPVDRSIYKIDVLDSKKIQLKAANNLGDLFRNELSFQYSPGGIFGDFLRIQGLTGEYIKILIDGIPLTGRVAGKIDMGQLSLYNVDHVEIIEGPMSAVI